jgi:cytochrome c-type biogenesis protein CcmH/NrfG
MIPKLLCPKCGNPIDTSDKFCSSCGVPIDWPSQSLPSRSSPLQPEQPVTDSVTCTACGHVNSSEKDHCVSCGAVLRKKRIEKAVGTPPPKETRNSGSAISFFQSWKFTLIAAVLLIGAVLFYSTTRKSNPHAGAPLSPGEESAIQEIETLQKRVDSTPGDTVSLLRLANLLQDVRFYTRAITTYQRYLMLVPQNADAWVDVGTSFFALSFEDSTRRVEYLASARQEILKALEVTPRHQLAYFNLGIIELHSGNIDKATEAFKKCIVIDANSDAGKKAAQFLTQHPLTNPSQ